MNVVQTHNFSGYRHSLSNNTCDFENLFPDENGFCSISNGREPLKNKKYLKAKSFKDLFRSKKTKKTE
jgi:hypothetical protein